MGVQIGGEFIGFSFGGTHSSTLGIIRTSDGSRYNQNLLPTIQDKTVQVPGGDGTYLFESFYTQRPINIPIAYDNLTEEQVGNIKRLFGDKKPKKLIFDETPYKYYWAKSTGTPNLKFICFGSNPDGTGRIYKGEGTLTFTCYDPFGYSTSRWVEGIEDFDEINGDAWLASSGLLRSEKDDWKEQEETHPEGPWAYYDKNATLINISSKSETFTIENNGDLETDWLVTVDSQQGEVKDLLGLTITTNRGDYIEFKNLKLEGNDIKVKINTKTNLIYGATDGTDSNNIYNKYITNGTFFKLPVGTTEITFTPYGNTHIGVFKFHYKYI